MEKTLHTDKLALRRATDGEACSIKRTLDIVGDAWSLLILREAFWGVRRFQDFQGLLGVPRSVLSQRLAKLSEHGLLERHPYREAGSRTREEYVLSPAGRDLLPVLMALMQWGDRHLGPGPVEMVDGATGARVAVRIVNEAGATVAPEGVRGVPRGAANRRRPAQGRGRQGGAPA